MTLATKQRIGVGEVRISAQARANVLEALDTNRLSYGKFTRQFEKRFAALHGQSFAAFVNSGTDALRIGLAAMKEKFRWQDGDEVLVPAVTFVASYNVIAQVGLKPVLVDIDPDDYGMTLQDDRLYNGTRRTVAVMPVNLFGQTVHPAVFDLARGRNWRVITDSCETMFVDGCADGHVSCFSTYACHLINTGVGGLATTNDPDLARLIRSLANHGRDGIYTGIDDELGNTETIVARFNFERMGYSSRATEMEAAIGCAELDVWESNLASRRANAGYLLNALADLPLVLPKVRPGGEHAWMMFPLRAQDRVVRDALVQHLESNGIETRPLLPLVNQPYLKALGVDESAYPVAQMVNETGFYVASHQYLTSEDLMQISEAFHSFWE